MIMLRSLGLVTILSCWGIASGLYGQEEPVLAAEEGASSGYSASSQQQYSGAHGRVERADAALQDTVKVAKTRSEKLDVVLLDTTSESSLDWTRYPYGPQSRTPGWVEESFTNFEQGINWRSYVVCDVAYKNVNNWLWTPFIERRDANRIYIEIKFSMRDCNLFPGMALSCKETFSLLYYEFDAAHKEPPPWEPESYKLIDRIAADEGRFTSNSEVIINTEVRSIPVTKKGVYFAFRDQGACLSLIAIKIYYMICPNVINNFALFPETPTGKELTAIVPAEGQCVANSVEVDKPRLLCKGDGNWTLPSGGCKCMSGYEPVGQACKVCPPATFKPVTGDELCGPCPAHSTAPYRGSTECRCDHGFYRAPKDPKWFPCTQPPSAPRNLTANFVDAATVLLSWTAPKFLGGRNDTLYRVECEPSCASTITFLPSSKNLTLTKVAVSNLSPLMSYRFLVYAENGASIHESGQFVDITVTTEASGYISLVITEDGGSASGQKQYNAEGSVTVFNVRVVAVKGSEIVLAWDTRDDVGLFSNDVPPTYEVKYFEKGQEKNASTVLTNKEEAALVNLKEKTDYAFQVRTKTATGSWTDYSKPVYKSTGQLIGSTAFIGEESSGDMGLVAGVSVAILVLIVVVASMVVPYLRRSADECKKKQPSDCDTLEYTRTGEVVPSLEHPPIVPTARFNSPFSATTPLFTHFSVVPRTYVDPHTYEDPHHHYEDPNQAMREFTKEVDASNMRNIEAFMEQKGYELASLPTYGQSGLGNGGGNVTTSPQHHHRSGRDIRRELTIARANNLAAAGMDPSQAFSSHRRLGTNHHIRHHQQQSMSSLHKGGQPQSTLEQLSPVYFSANDRIV